MCRPRSSLPGGPSSTRAVQHLRQLPAKPEAAGLGHQSHFTPLSIFLPTTSWRQHQPRYGPKQSKPAFPGPASTASLLAFSRPNRFTPSGRHSHNRGPDPGKAFSPQLWIYRASCCGGPATIAARPTQPQRQRPAVPSSGMRLNDPGKKPGHHCCPGAGAWVPSFSLGG